MRPARRQQSTCRQLQRSLEVGDEVVLSAGIFGTIARSTTPGSELEIAPAP